LLEAQQAPKSQKTQEEDMRKIALGLMAASLFAAPAFAQTPMTFADVDGNGDGRLSYEELATVWPDLTQEEFAGADVEGLGLTPEQLNSLQPTSVPAPAPAPTDVPPAN
jgi:hypothetical protein